MLSKSDFKPFANLRKSKVSLPDMGGEIFVRELSAGEFLEFGEKSSAASSVTDRAELALWLFARSIVDENGSRMFEDSEKDLIGSSISKADFEAIRTVVFSINGLNSEEVEKKSGTP